MECQGQLILKFEDYQYFTNVKKMCMIKVTDVLSEEVLSVWEG